MNRYKRIFAIFAGAVMLLSLTIVASAQRRNRQGNDDYYNRSSVNLSYAVKNLKNNSRRFESQLDRELDRSRYDGTRREDNLNDLAKQFSKAADNLEDEYDSRSNRRNGSSNEASRVLQLGSQLDRALTRSRIVNQNSGLQNLWSAVENDLVTIGRAYNYNYNGTYSRNRRGNRDQRDDRNGTNNGNYNRNLQATIKNLKNDSNRLEKQIDRRDDDRRGNRRGNNLEDLADKFNDAVNDLDKEYDNRRDYNDSTDEVRRVLNIGQQLDREISRAQVNSNVRNTWNRIEQNLRVLSNAYNGSYNNTNNNNRRIGLGDILKDFPF